MSPLFCDRGQRTEDRIGYSRKLDVADVDNNDENDDDVDHLFVFHLIHLLSGGLFLGVCSDTLQIITRISV